MGANWLVPNWVACGMRSTSGLRQGITLLALRIRVIRVHHGLRAARLPHGQAAVPCCRVTRQFGWLAATLPMAGAVTTLVLRRTGGHFGLARAPRSRESGLDYQGNTDTTLYSIARFCAIRVIPDFSRRVFPY